MDDVELNELRDSVKRLEAKVDHLCSRAEEGLEIGLDNSAVRGTRVCTETEEEHFLLVSSPYCLP